MKIKIVIALFIGVLILLVWLEKFLPRTKHNISAPRRVLRAIDEFFMTKNNDQSREEGFSWKRSISIIVVVGGFLFLVLWDSFK